MTAKRLWMLTAASFLVLLAFGGVLEWQRERSRIAQKRHNGFIAATEYSERLKDRLSRSLAAAYALSAVVHQTDGKVERFDSFAENLMHVYGGISSLQLAPSGVIQSIHPLKGNEAAMGHRLFADPKRNQAAIVARQTGEMTLAGPFELIQGGVAVVGRLPIFLSSSAEPDKFWGFATVVIGIPELLNSSDFEKLEISGYNYQLWHIARETGSRSVFASSHGSNLTDPLSYAFDVPNGKWHLSFAPRQGWYSMPATLAESSIVLVVALGLTALIHFFLRQPLILSKQVAEQTAELRNANANLESEVQERATAQRALAESERRFRSIFEHAPVGIINIARDGKLLGSNLAFQKMLGYTAEELSQMTVMDITHPNDLERTMEAFRVFCETRANIAELEKRYLRKDGKPIWVQVNASTVLDEDGNFSHSVTMLLDITERNNLESRLRQSEKMQAIGTLAGGIAHDFNNILAAIRGNAKIISEDLPPGHPCLENIDEVNKASRRAAELVRQILSFSRASDSERAPLSITPLVSDALKLLQATLPSTILIQTDFPKEDLFVQSNPTEMHQILLNLGSNAEHAMRGGTGKLVVSLSSEDIQAPAVLQQTGLPPGRYVILTVTDTGMGMSPDVSVRAAEPFFTTKPVGQGTGLGLSVVHGIMASVGGTLSIESRPGIGTKIALYFPQIAESLTMQDQESTPPQKGHGERILFIDDEEQLVFLAKRMLGRLGYQVFGYTQPEAALQAFLDNPNEFDAVMCDVSMPGMSGFEVVKKMREVKTSAPIVIMSGYIRAEDEVRAKEVGVTDIILKPNTVEEIGPILHRIFNNMPATRVSRAFLGETHQSAY